VRNLLQIPVRSRSIFGHEPSLEEWQWSDDHCDPQSSVRIGEAKDRVLRKMLILVEKLRERH